MNKPGLPQSQNFWYLKNYKKPKQLCQTIKTDVVIIGGGMAGLSAAQNFRKKGLKVVLLEQYYCGSGASGKSSGFITPNSELDLSHFKRKYGFDAARAIWDFDSSGVQFIENNIKTYNINCDYQKQDTLVVANNRWGYKDLVSENETRKEYNYESSLFDANSVSQVIGSQDYVGGVLYGNSFGIDPYAYCQAMKDIIEEMGVEIYEETPVIALGDRTAITVQGSVQADHVVLCTDRFIPELGKLTYEIFHAQTILMISAPLSDQQARAIFPKEPYLVWDTDLIYQYYRLTGDNRLLLGGCSMWQTFSATPNYNAQSIYRKLTRYFNKKFPGINPQFEYMWPGFIGISKDIVPIMGADKDLPWLYYVGAATGLPWAAALGNYSAEHIVDKRTDMDTFFSPYRSFPINRFLHFFMGNRAAFGLSLFISEKLR